MITSIDWQSPTLPGITSIRSTIVDQVDGKFDPSTRPAFEVAITEVLINAVEATSAAGGSVRITVDEHCIVVQSPLVAERVERPNSTSSTGRGLFIAQSVWPSVAWTAVASTLRVTVAFDAARS